MTNMIDALDSKITVLVKYSKKNKAKFWSNRVRKKFPVSTEPFLKFDLWFRTNF